jgi:hypothetical protein
MAILTVCASGCDYTTLGAAITAATATDDIDLQIDIDETLKLSKNVNKIYTSNGSTWDGTGNGANQTLELQNGITQLITFEGLQFDHSSGTARTILVPSVNASGSVKFVNCKFKHTSGTTSAYILNQTNAHAGYWTAERCEFDGNNTADAVVFNNSTTAGTARFDNCIFKNHTSGGHGLEFPAATTNNVLELNYCNFHNNDNALDINARCTVKNCLFTNNTDDIDTTRVNFNRADFDYCAFEEQTDDDVAWGANCIFGITSTDEYTNEAGMDFTLKSGAQSKDAGVSVAGITVDYNGNTREVGSSPDIGFLEKQAVNGGAYARAFIIS